MSEDGVPERDAKAEVLAQQRLTDVGVVEALAASVESQTSILRLFSTRLDGFATTTDLADRVEWLETKLRHETIDVVKRGLLIGAGIVVAVSLAVGVWAASRATDAAAGVNRESRNRSVALCDSSNRQATTIRSIIALATTPLPLNPQSSPTIQAQIRARNAAAAAFRAEVDSLAPVIDCAAVSSGAPSRAGP
jgi:hypothetical protein